jgi:hypothetical protein
MDGMQHLFPLMVMPAHVVAKAQAEAPVLLDLPDSEISALVRALTSPAVSFGMNRSAARIVEAIAAKEAAELSPAQRNAAIRIAYRYRRQLPRAVLVPVQKWDKATLQAWG